MVNVTLGNATSVAYPDVVKLMHAGASAAGLGRLAGAHRATASRWLQGARPRGQAKRRLHRAARLLRGWPAGSRGRFVAWLEEPSALLDGHTPSSWIAADRPDSPLADAWVEATGGSVEAVAGAFPQLRDPGDKAQRTRIPGPAPAGRMPDAQEGFARPSAKKSVSDQPTVSHSRPEMKVLVLTALPEEFQAVIDHLELGGTTRDRNLSVYTHGKFEGRGRVWDVAVVECGRGNLRAATLASNGLEHIGPDVVLFIGVAGGVKDVGLGDVVAGNKVYDYETGKDADTFESRPESFNADNALQSAARYAASSNKWHRRIRPPGARPRALVGPIAAGSKVAANTREGSIYSFVRQRFSDALALETEAAGFFTACQVAGARAMVIRGISDMVEGKAEEDQKGGQAVAAGHAAAFAFEVLADLDLGQPSGGRSAVARESGIPIPPAAKSAFEVLQARSPETVTRLLGGLNIPGRSLRETASELIGRPPGWLEAAPVDVWVALGNFAQSHGAGRAASTAYERVAVEGGVPRGRWLARAAWASLTDKDLTRGHELLARAEALTPGDPLVNAMKAVIKEDAAGLLAVTDRSGLDDEETLTVDAAVAGARWIAGDMAAALTLLEELARRYPDRGFPLQQAAIFRLARVAKGKSIDRVADLERARQDALRARDLIRQWGGDSSEAVRIAAQVALAGSQPDAVLRIALPASDGGEATAQEAANLEVMNVAIQAALVLRKNDLVAALNSRLPRAFPQAVYQAMLLKRKYGKTDSVVAAFMNALKMATTSVERFAALYQLADLGVWPLPEQITSLEGADPEQADMVLARAELSRGEADSAKMRLRKWSASSPQAAGALADAYDESGDPTGAIDVLRSAAERFKAPELLVDGVDSATRYELYGEAEQLAQEALLSLPPSAAAARVHILGRLVALAGRRADWRALEERSMTLRREADSPSARWALIVSLVNQSKFEQAWSVMSEAPSLEPPDQRHAELKLSLLAQFAPGAESVEEILNLVERFPQTETFVAGALMSIYTMNATEPLPDPIQARLNQALEAFIKAYPDSSLLRRVAFEKPEEAIEKIATELREGYDDFVKLAGRVAEGELPFGTLASLKNRSYCLALLEREDFPLVVSIPGFHDQELQAARGSLGNTVVADISAVVVGMNLNSSWPQLSSVFHKVLVSDIAVRDGAWAARVASAKSTLSLGLDPVTKEARLRETTDEQARKLSTSARELNQLLLSLEQVQCSEFVLFQNLEPTKYGAWTSPLEVAAKGKRQMWSDDAVQRALGREMGVQAFGTVHLMKALLETGRLVEQQVQDWLTAMLRSALVDLPFDEALFLRAARAGSWSPSPAGIALARAAVWIDHQRALHFFDGLFRQVSTEAADHLPYWMTAAIVGGGRRAGNRAADLAGILLGLAISGTRFDSKSVPSLVQAARQAMSLMAVPQDPLPIAAQRILLTVEKLGDASGAARFVANLFSELDQLDRTVVSGVVFGPARPTE